ncbi:hypothetical protein [Streptomyces sp. NPDC051684]|uniref:hypothetical protein n=1 Tax=Streptomyces sp. NPDC051684 TaxID=3365670 RepID=UPI0037AA4479
MLEQVLAQPEFARLPAEVRVRLRDEATRERLLTEAQAAAEYAGYLQARGTTTASPAFSRARDGVLPALAVLVPAISAIAAAVFLGSDSR